MRGPGAGPDVPPALLEEGLGNHEVVLGDLEEEVGVVPGEKSNILNFSAKFLNSGSCCTSRGRGLPRRSRAPPRPRRRAHPRSSCASAGAQFNRKKIDLSFGLKNGLRIQFHSVTRLLTIFNFFSVEHLKPK